MRIARKMPPVPPIVDRVVGSLGAMACSIAPPQPIPGMVGMRGAMPPGCAIGRETGIGPLRDRWK